MKNVFENLGIISDNLLHLSPKETFEICKMGATIVDVREDFMIGYKKFAVPNVIYCPASNISETFNILFLNDYLIVADSVGIHSKEVAKFLVNKGFVNIANMAGGLVEWERDGLPLQVNLKEELSGQCACQLKAKKK